MNSKQRNKHKGLKCSHLFQDTQCLTNDPVPYYQDEEWCKIKDSDIMEENGIQEYRWGYCLKCPHFNPSREEIRECRRFMKYCRNQKKVSEPKSDFDFFDFL